MKLKSLNVTITKCDDCPFHRSEFDTDYTEVSCHHKSLILPRLITHYMGDRPGRTDIPNWCPLEDTIKGRL